MDTSPSSHESAAPAHSEPPSYLLVLSAGIATSALTLWAIYWLDVHVRDFHIMGWHADYVIPIGAILVGIVAASGYGLVSWLSGIKITRALLAGVLLLQFGAYFGAQYVEFKSMKLYYKDTNTPVGFFKYYDISARSFAWKAENGTIGSPLGIWGYLFRGLEVIGFAAGGLIVPLALWKAPYCQSCRRYMRRKLLATMPASVPVKKFKKSDKEGSAAHQEEQTRTFKTSQEFLEHLRQMAVEGRTADFQNAIAPLNAAKRRKEISKLPIRNALHLVSCRQCADGWLKVVQFVGHGKKIKATELPRTGVPQDFVLEMHHKP
ncbi:MAG: hypothetical protein WCD79_16965 [Chthoniobacteraceae bacterium]